MQQGSFWNDQKTDTELKQTFEMQRKTANLSNIQINTAHAMNMSDRRLLPRLRLSTTPDISSKRVNSSTEDTVNRLIKTIGNFS